MFCYHPLNCPCRTTSENTKMRNFLNSGIRAEEFRRMFCHPPTNSPCRKTRESVKIWKMLNSGNPDSGWMRSGFRWMWCHPPLICPCQTIEESLNSLKFLNSGIPDSGWMFCHPPSNCPCQTTQESAKVEENWNSGILESGRMGSDSRRMICHPPSKCLCETTQESVNSGKFLILEFSKSEFRIPDGWVPAAGGGFFHPPFNCPCQTTQDSVKIWKYLNSGIPASGRMNFGWEYVYSLLPDGNDPEAKNPDPIGAFLSKFRIPATNPESGEKSGIRRMSCWTADWCRLRGRGKLFTTCTDTFHWPAVACRYFSSSLCPPPLSRKIYLF